jgi:hypothetical protein
LASFQQCIFNNTLKQQILKILTLEDCSSLARLSKFLKIEEQVIPPKDFSLP